MSLRAYQQASQRAETPRELEYRLFGEVTRSLMAAAELPDHEIGARGAISFIPGRLEPIYQARRPTSLAVYATIRPGASHQHH